MMKWLRRAMGTRSASNSAGASGLSTCLVRDTFCRWSSPKRLPAPSPSLSALRSLALTGCGRSGEAEMSRYDDTFVDRFLEPWNRNDVDGALALMTDDCVWEVTRGREPHGTLYTGRAFAQRSWRRLRRSPTSITNPFGCCAIRRAYDRHHHPAPLRYLSLFGESPARPWPQRSRLGVGRDPRHHAETRSDGADRGLSQDARAANRRRHLLRQSTDHARAGAPTSEPGFLSGRSRRGGCACVVGREDYVQPGGRYRFRQAAGRVARRVPRRPRQILRPQHRSGRNDGGTALSIRSAACASALARSDDGRRALVLTGRGGRP